jgi:hypothetical protein
MKFRDLKQNHNKHISVLREHVESGVPISELVDIDDAVCLRYQPILTPWDNNLNYDPLDLPFKKCFFESSGDNVLFNIAHPNGGILFVFAIYVVEHSPRNYSIDIMGFERLNDKTSPVFIDGIDYFRVRGALDSLLDRLQRSKRQCFDLTKTSSTSWGKKVDVSILSVNKVIYIGNSTVRHKTKGSRNYTPSKYSFNVRGHWRSINPNSVGKDREGNRCVAGMTWVTECSKGSGPLMKKSYLVKS